jgi:hypothetical protein
MFLLAVVLALGCGRKANMRVWGTVSYDGEPIENGTILFVPIDETPGPSTGGNITEGGYDVPSAGGPLVHGVYRVEINASKPTGKILFAERYGSFPEYVSLVPPQYNTRSTLKVAISDQEKANNIDFPLKTPVP